MIDFNPTTFESHFRAIVADGESDFELDEIDDTFHRTIPHSDDARICSHLAVQILRAADRPWSFADALNTALCASCLSGDVEQARMYLEELIDVTAKHGTKHAARGAAENIRHLLPGRANPDYVLHLLHLVVRLYTHLGMPGKVIETQIIAAHLFADFGAYPAALRTLTDAQELARDQKLTKQYLAAVSALHGIYLQKEDHASADQVWKTVGQNCAEAGIAMPMSMLVNRATTLFQTGDLGAAKCGFEEALAVMEADGSERLGVLINLSACLRELGDRSQSQRRMAEAREVLSTLTTLDPEHPLELELIAAKSAVHHGNLDEAATCLRNAIKSLDAAVGLVEKLHYRRGIRERYVPRIEGVLAGLAPSGKAEDVIPVIAATRANRMSDWLHFLEWTRAISMRLTVPERDELDGLVSRLANHGAPHLYGLRERADDPMSSTSFPDPWRDLAEYADRVCLGHGVSRPFERASSRSAAELIMKRLAEGYAVFVNMFTGGQKVLLLIGGRYMFGDLPGAETKAFSEMLLRHRFEPQQKAALAKAAATYQVAMLASLRPLLGELAGEGCRGVIFVPDKMDLTPIGLIALGHPAIRAKMAAGQFEVRTCLALFPARRYAGAPHTCLGIIEPGSNLSFDRADVESFFKGSGAAGTLLEKPTWEEFSERMASTDSLFLAHHGMSVALFKDPYFADMAGVGDHSSMSLAAIQEVAFRWPHRLVVLGTCHSGGLVNHNFQSAFRTHDLIGFPTVFLVNGECEVVAASWEILDRFNLVFTTLLAPRLDGVTVSQAVSRALALLHEMPSGELTELLFRSLPAGVELSAAALSQIDVMRRQPLCYGAYQTYTLL
jgi:tetratricopeptide (TPR) repeat protein